MPPLPGSIYGCRGKSARLSGKRGIRRPSAHPGSLWRHEDYKAQNGRVTALRLESPPLVRGTPRASVKRLFEQALERPVALPKRGDSRWVACRRSGRMPARTLSARRAGWLGCDCVGTSGRWAVQLSRPQQHAAQLAFQRQAGTQSRLLHEEERSSRDQGGGDDVVREPRCQSRGESVQEGLLPEVDRVARATDGDDRSGAERLGPDGTGEPNTPVDAEGDADADDRGRDREGKEGVLLEHHGRKHGERNEEEQAGFEQGAIAGIVPETIADTGQQAPDGGRIR